MERDGARAPATALPKLLCDIPRGLQLPQVAARVPTAEPQAPRREPRACTFAWIRSISEFRGCVFPQRPAGGRAAAERGFRPGRSQVSRDSQFSLTRRLHTRTPGLHFNLRGYTGRTPPQNENL